MLRALQILLTAIIVDFYWFPVSFTFAVGLNTKMMLALAGAAFVALDIIQRRVYTIPKSLMGAILLAALYSVTNLVAVEVNDTFDFSYANYITSFFVWIFSAYATVKAIEWTHSKVSIKLLTLYLAYICAFQCVIAIVMDKFDPVKSAINSVFFIAEDFFDKIDRLYGIGAVLDPAGTRFSIVLVMMAFVLSIDEKIKSNIKSTLGLILTFFIIAVLGNMMSRTTTVGLSLGLATLLINTGLYRLKISAQSLHIFKILGPTLLVGIPLIIMLYNTDVYTRGLLRYGFEGFFNWMETGTWETGSTNVLANMWKWPETTKAWLIGTGVYGLFNFGTDIGYCRLILYSGLIGFSIFALFFVYHAYVFITKYRRYRYMFLVLLSMSFIIWYKASTDLFMIYALFYCFDDEDEMGYAPKFSL